MPLPRTKGWHVTRGIDSGREAARQVWIDQRPFEKSAQRFQPRVGATGTSALRSRSILTCLPEIRSNGQSAMIRLEPGSSGSKRQLSITRRRTICVFGSRRRYSGAAK